MTAQLLAQRPTIKILLYTDDPNAITDGKNLLGLGSMIDRLNDHAPVFAKLSVKWVSRSSDQNHHADNKLDVVLRREVEQTGEPFDEIWFFGLHQANTERFSLGAFRGGPESELTVEEVAELDKWMKVDGGCGGGVLMTGDHNNPVPPKWLRNKNGPCTDPVENPELLGLGRAIGRCVPRAGELRKWDGPPSSRIDESLNTLAKAGFQTDRVPQKLINEKLNADGEPDPNGQPHPLFFYHSGRLIDIFPDHRHEGALVMPDLSNTAVWPVGPKGQPKPCVVAFGTDKRSGKRVPLLTAYDGDDAGVGRIVADSSWHHYVNINLKGFPHPARLRSYSDKIGQFYGNLAIWLAPLHKRRQMAEAMYWELADFTLLLEQQEDPIRTGEAAYSVLRRSASPCEIHELLRASGQQQLTGDRFSGSRIEDPAKAEALGLVLASYHRAMIQAEEESVLLASGLEKIVEREPAKAIAASANSSGGRSINVNIRSPLVSDRPPAPTTTVGITEWTIELIRDAHPNKLPFAATLIFNLTSQNGVVSGDVWEGIDRKFLSPVKGTHELKPGTESWFLTLQFRWGSVNVDLSGETVETPATVLFNGRFTASASTEPVANNMTEPTEVIPPMGPGDGDTGTGTGQQT